MFGIDQSKMVELPTALRKLIICIGTYLDLVDSVEL